jgi:hypothetical protein
MGDLQSRHAHTTYDTSCKHDKPGNLVFEIGEPLERGNAIRHHVGEKLPEKRYLELDLRPGSKGYVSFNLWPGQGCESEYEHVLCRGMLEREYTEMTGRQLPRYNNFIEFGNGTCSGMFRLDDFNKNKWVIEDDSDNEEDDSDNEEDDSDNEEDDSDNEEDDSDNEEDD